MSKEIKKYSDEIPGLFIYHRDKKLADLQVKNFLRSFLLNCLNEEKKIAKHLNTVQTN